MKELLNIRSIVVCTDFTAASGVAVIYATRFAQHYAAKLLLVHIVDPSSTTAEEMDVSHSVLHEAVESAKADLRQISADLKRQEIENHWLVRHGDVRDLILEVVHEHHADLLVLGSKGMVLAGRSRYGNTAEKLMRAAPCPVLTVVPDARWQELKDDHRRLLLVPTDFSEASQVALLYAISFAQSVRAKLLLLHAVENHPPEPIGRHLAELRSDGMHRLLAYAHAANVEAECVIRTGSVLNLTLAMANEHKADYIVLGVRGGNLVDGTRLRGLICDLIRQSPCPVLSTYTGTPRAPVAAKEENKPTATAVG